MPSVASADIPESTRDPDRTPRASAATPATSNDSETTPTLRSVRANWQTPGDSYKLEADEVSSAETIKSGTGTVQGTKFHHSQSDAGLVSYMLLERSCNGTKKATAVKTISPYSIIGKNTNREQWVDITYRGDDKPIVSNNTAVWKTRDQINTTFAEETVDERNAIERDVKEALGLVYDSRIGPDIAKAKAGGFR
ncbi:uncharacterized protein IL334_007929 [Kwoniella shivajii]|uniref:Uncharacterized protein n=1 Tax=Kwoniella shivajii TaxID=564305 RepID=A0ABZ1D9Z9_9TREE|nr:hypothetical protein IL334_007929 [Kwoniella shivajii]